LAFLIETVGDTPTHKIAIVPLDAGPKPSVRLLDANAAVSDGPIFTPDGKAFVYPIVQNGVGNLWLQPLDGSIGHQITNFKTDTIASTQWSPDGKSIGILSRRTEADVVLLRESSAQ